MNSSVDEKVNAAVAGDGSADQGGEGVAGEPPAAEAPAPEGDAAAVAPDAERLQARLAEAEAEIARLREDALRARAELDNVRKRTEREVENAYRYGAEKLALEFLPVKDSMELGLASAATAEDVASVREGIELTLKALATALERLGISEVDPQGARFDPQYHQAIATEERADTEPGTVIDVVQKGYLLHDRLLRPALVRVAARPTEAEA